MNFRYILKYNSLDKIINTYEIRKSLDLRFFVLFYSVLEFIENFKKNFKNFAKCQIIISSSNPMSFQSPIFCLWKLVSKF